MTPDKSRIIDIIGMGFTILIVMFTVFLAVISIINTNTEYRDYLVEHALAVESTTVTLDYVDFNDDNEVIAVSINDNRYFIEHIYFDEDVTEPTILLEKTEAFGWLVFVLHGRTVEWHQMYEASLAFPKE